MKLYEKGEPNETLFRIIEKAVRVPDIVLGDIRGQVASLHFGEQEYRKLIARYGAEELETTINELLDYTEMAIRKAISEWPEGTWSFTDYIDDDGFTDDQISIVTTITKKGDH